MAEFAQFFAQALTVAVMRRSDGGRVILRIDCVRVFEEIPSPRTED